MGGCAYTSMVIKFSSYLATCVRARNDCSVEFLQLTPTSLLNLIYILNSVRDVSGNYICSLQARPELHTLNPPCYCKFREEAKF